MKYSDDEKLKQILAFCKYLAIDNLSHREAWKKPDACNKDTFYKWTKENPLFNEHYLRACAVKADSLAQKGGDIVFNTDNDFYTDHEGNKRPNPTAVQRDKLGLEYIKWKTAVEAPRKYGKQVDITSGGDKIKHAPVSIVIDSKDISDKMKM